MIDYVEIRNASRELIGIIDSAASIIWHAEYYGTGDFEVYTACNPSTAAMLTVGNFVTKPFVSDMNIYLVHRLTLHQFSGRTEH